MDDSRGRSDRRRHASIIWPTAWMPERSRPRSGVFVKKGETARELWERALAPLGQKLLGEVIDYAKTHKALPAKPQDEQFATKGAKPSGLESPNEPSLAVFRPCDARFSFELGSAALVENSGRLSHLLFPARNNPQPKYLLCRQLFVLLRCSKFWTHCPRISRRSSHNQGFHSCAIIAFAQRFSAPACRRDRPRRQLPRPPRRPMTGSGMSPS